MYVIMLSTLIIASLLKDKRYCDKKKAVFYDVDFAFGNRPVSQYERPRAAALASSACVDKTTKIITEFTRKDPFLHLKRANN